MTLEQAENIIDVACNYCNAEVYENYSGRGMYGETCVGITTDNPIMVAYCAGLVAGEARAEGDDSWDDFELPTRTDSLGFDTIIY